MNEQLEFYADLVKSGAARALGRLNVSGSLWDLVVITAISAGQRACYEAQVERKLASGRLPRCFEYAVVSDPEGAKIGSGGSTLNVLRVLHDRYGDHLFSLKVLLLHCGGYSQRVPFNTVLGKIFAPVPCSSPCVNDVLDIQLAIFTPLSLHMQPGIFLTSSDIVVTGGLEEQIGAGRLFGRDGNAFSLLAHRVSLDTGKDHGLYGIERATEPASGSSSFGHFECQFVLQKPSIAKMRATPGVVQLDTSSGQEYVNCDSSFYFSHAVSRTLKRLQEQHLDSLVADGIELDAYRDFLQPLGSQPISLDEFLVSAKSRADVFRDVYSAFAGLRTAVLALTRSQFFHLGTIHEILELYLADSDEARSFRRAICFTHRKPGKGSDLGVCGDVDVGAGAAGESSGGVYYSRVNEACQLSAKCLLEYCSVGDGLALELEDGAYVNSCRLRASELSNATGSVNRVFRVPKNTCMHTVAIRDAGKDGNQVSYVTIFFQRGDDLKKRYESLTDLNWLGKTLSVSLADQLTSSPELAPGCSVWSLRVFRAASTMTESFVNALRFCHSYLQEKEDNSLDVSGQLYSLFDILRLQSFESMIQFREEMTKHNN